MVRLLVVTLLLAVPAQERRIPPPGIPVPPAEAAALEEDLDRLAAEVASLPQDEKLLPDVEVFHKAVRYALRYGEFFHAREFAAARELLAEGMARLRALREGQAPWTAATGLVVRGYRSRIDDSVQPYGLVVPDSFRPDAGRRHRLDVWFHGRDEKLTEVKFLAERRRSRGEFAPADAFVLHPYGRFCNANKFAGETDLFEALEHVRQAYPIDEDRIVVRGFSMGGAACWHFAVHHAWRWAAAAPGAGFAETPQYARLLQGPVAPPAYEQKLWSLYNATDYAANLFHCPTVAYSGELDRQKQAADIMGRAMAEEGLELVHIVGPGTEHKYHPEAKAEIDRRIDALAARGRERLPNRVRFTTWTLRYNRMHWVVVDALEAHWERARIEAEVVDGVLRARTLNVAAVAFERADLARVVLDDQELEAGAGRFRKVSGRWVPGGPEAGLRKRHGLQGPVDDAFMDRFVFVRPTGTPLHRTLADPLAARMERAIVSWRSFFRGDVRVVDDRSLSGDDLRTSHLVLWGDPGSNAVLGRIAARLPLRWDARGVTVGDRVYGAEGHVPVLVYPNPLQPERYVVLNSGYTFIDHSAASNSRHVPVLPDWAVLEAATGKPAAAGFFDERWQLPPR